MLQEPMTSPYKLKYIPQISKETPKVKTEEITISKKTAVVIAIGLYAAMIWAFYFAEVIARWKG